MGIYWRTDTICGTFLVCWTTLTICLSMMTENSEMESGEAQLQRSPSTASIQPMTSKASTRSSELLHNNLLSNLTSIILKSCLQPPQIHYNTSNSPNKLCRTVCFTLCRQQKPAAPVTCFFFNDCWCISHLVYVIRTAARWRCIHRWRHYVLSCIRIDVILSSFPLHLKNTHIVTLTVTMVRWWWYHHQEVLMVSFRVLLSRAGAFRPKHLIKRPSLVCLVLSLLHTRRHCWQQHS